MEVSPPLLSAAACGVPERQVSSVAAIYKTNDFPFPKEISGTTFATPPNLHKKKCHFALHLQKYVYICSLIIEHNYLSLIINSLKINTMKKVLLLTLSLALGFSAFAQQRVMRNDAVKATASAKKATMGKEMSVETATNFAPITAKSCVVNRWENMEYAPTIMTTYDLQSNQYVANRMYQMPDGSVAAAATMSHQYNQSATDRGSGYNFYKDGQWEFEDLEEMNRIEPFKTGWPTITRWGKDGEILIAHGGGNGTPSGLQCFTREVAGDGEWQFMSTLPLCPDGYPYAGASDAYPTWARVVTSGEDNTVINVAAAIQHSISSDESVVHCVLLRSEDAINWTISYGPLEEYGYETGFFSADDYCMAAKGLGRPIRRCRLGRSRVLL